MGYYKHHAILVTGETRYMVQAHEEVLRLYNRVMHLESVAPVNMISDRYKSPVGDFESFAIFPDGSKEGWDDSDHGDEFRKQVVDALRSMLVDWIEVSYGGDYNHGTVISYAGNEGEDYD